MTAHNDITGDSIRTGKGSLEKYAQGWDNIFKPKKEPMVLDASGVHMQQADGSTLSFTSEGAMKLTGLTPESAEKWLQCFKRQGLGVAEPTTVMALDFHDSVAVKRNLFEELVEGFDALKEYREEVEQAREDAWRESEQSKGANAVMLGKYKGENIG